MEMKLPTMGESVTQATISKLFVETGAIVATDQEIMEVETEKLNQVLYAPGSGAITLRVREGDVVAIGQLVATIEAAAGAPPAPPAPKPAPVAASVAAPPPPVAPAVVGEVRKPLSAVRRAIARRLLEAQRQTATLTTFNEADMSAVMAAREHYQEAFQKRHGVKLGFMSFVVKACVRAIQQFPDVNSYLDGDMQVWRKGIDIGVAVGTDKGLFVPVVRGCEALSFAGIERSIAASAEKARGGTLQPDDLAGGGFTITNGGVYGSLLSTPILNPPQCAILGMHKIQKRPVVVDDQIVIRPMMYLALSYDHRILDGKAAVSFLVEVKNALEDPERIQLEI